MGQFIKCGNCGNSNRSYHSHCYSCKESLDTPSERAEQVKQEVAEVVQMEKGMAFYGKLFVFVLALFVCRPYFTQRTVYGVFEWAILPFHEAGHYALLFAPRTIMVAGGTFVQLALPLAFAIYFAYWRKEYFSATVPTLWLFGSMQQMAVYMKDARFLLLPMFGVDPSEGHDWNYLFGKMHLLHKSVEIGNFFHGFARLGIALTLGVMTYLLLSDPGRPWHKQDMLSE